MMEVRVSADFGGGELVTYGLGGIVRMVMLFRRVVRTEGIASTGLHTPVTLY
jgi:hypothetical protein